jgi:hypothetical protein
MLTAEPLATLAAAAGLSLMTLPEATVALACIVTVPSVRPAPVMAVVAAAWVLPTTFGTATFCVWFIACLAFEPRLQADSTVAVISSRASFIATVRWFEFIYASRSRFDRWLSLETMGATSATNAHHPYG